MRKKKLNDKLIFNIIMYGGIGFAFVYHLQFIRSEIGQYVLWFGLLLMIFMLLCIYHYIFIRKKKDIGEVEV